MLARDPRKRPDAQTILNHEWMRGGSGGVVEAPMQPEILRRLRRFAHMNRFKKEALRVSHYLHQAQATILWFHHFCYCCVCTCWQALRPNMLDISLGN
jgi:hypothetical protein